MSFSLSVDIRFEGKFSKYFRITELFSNYLVIIVKFCFDLPADRVKFAPYELGIWPECFLVAVYFLVMRIMVFFPVIWGQIRRDWIFWTLFVTAFVLCCIWPGSGSCVRYGHECLHRYALCPQFLGPDADSERENNGQVSPQEILEFRFLRIPYKKAVSNHRHGFSQLTNYLSEGKR